ERQTKCPHPGALASLAALTVNCTGAPAVIQAAGPEVVTPAATPTVNAPVPEQSSPEPSAQPVQRVWVDPALPEMIKEGITLSPGTSRAGAGEAEAARLSILPEKSTGPAGLYWVYALVTPFSQRRHEATEAEVRQAWRGAALEKALWMSAETRAVFSARWGAPGKDAIHLEPPGDLLDQAWQAGAEWAIVPFEQVEPRWRVLRVGGQSPFDPGFRIDTYSLSVPIVWQNLRGAEPAILPESNYRRDQLTVLAMTGVTALVRRTATLINTKGVLYPASTLDGWLSDADLTHISNEVSFNSDRPPAKAALEEALFCSPPSYIRLLERAGTDVVELTGNHNLDRGKDAYLETLAMYAQRGWLTYGGGADLEQADRPLLVENHGNRLAFLGCNMAGPDIAWAAADSPGAAPCAFPRLEAQVKDLRQAGYLPVVTLQAFETEDYSPAPMQQPTAFLRLAEAGAVVVSGSQAHVPQGFKFGGDGLIHFGLGNLFFDQTDSALTRRAFIDRHVFYQGCYLGVELVPIVLKEYGRPEPMRAADRDEFMDTIF
ncbi:MAG TPA: CapA family protein, partial [Anaerolinea sp.]|nr:CapA family protein [Anaerolinea sp.]